jgi:anthranilate phosphoribosyltransferase
VKKFFLQELGFKNIEAETIFGGNTKEEAAKIFRNILEGKGTYEQNAVVLANAAKALQNTGKFENYEASLAAAKESLESGKALNSLQLLVDC